MAHSRRGRSAFPTERQSNVSNPTSGIESAVERQTPESGICSEWPFRDLIAWHETQARKEVLRGCFGLAEISWKMTYSIASTRFPREKITALIAAELGRFLNRFLQNSRVPAAYLRVSLEIERHLGASETDLATLLIEFASCLTAGKDYNEAEAVLKAVLETNSEVETMMHASLQLGRLLRDKGDILKSEEVLRHNLEIARNQCSRPEVMSEVLMTLGETLIEKEAFTECESVILEALTISQEVSPQYYLAVLRIYSRLRNKTAFDPRKYSVFEVALEHLSESHPYLRAAAHERWAEVSKGKLVEEAVLHWLRALSLYRSVQPSSLYAARVLQNLADISEMRSNSELEQCVRELAQEEFVDLLDSLPATFTIMALPDSDSFDGSRITTKLFEIAEQNPETLTSEIDVLAYGEVLLRLYEAGKTGKQKKRFSYLMNCFVKMHPSNEVTKKLLQKEEASKRAVALITEKKQHSNFSLAADTLCQLEEAAQVSKVKSPLSYSTAKSFWKLGNQYCRLGDIDRAEACYLQTLEMYTAVNPKSSLAINHSMKLAYFYQELGRVAEAEFHYSQIDFNVGFDHKYINEVMLFYNSIQREDKLLAVWMDFLHSI